MKESLEAHDRSKDYLQALDPANVNFDIMPMMDCSECFSRGATKVVFFHFLGMLAISHFDVVEKHLVADSGLISDL